MYKVVELALDVELVSDILHTLLILTLSDHGPPQGHSLSRILHCRVSYSSPNLLGGSSIHHTNDLSKRSC